MTDLPGPSLFGTARDKAELFRERYSILQQVRNVLREGSHTSCQKSILPLHLSASQLVTNNFFQHFMTLFFLGLVLLPDVFFRLSFIIWCYWSSVSQKQILVKGAELLRAAGWNRVRTFWSVLHSAGSKLPFWQCSFIFKLNHFNFDFCRGLTDMSSSLLRQLLLILMTARANSR